jgi:hypothetical protein
MSIRVTLTLDDDLVERVKARAIETQLTFRETVNQLLRLALGSGVVSDLTFSVEAHAIGLKPGLNLDKPHQLFVERDCRKLLSRHRQRRKVAKSIPN